MVIRMIVPYMVPGSNVFKKGQHSQDPKIQHASHLLCSEGKHHLPCFQWLPYTSYCLQTWCWQVYHLQGPSTTPLQMKNCSSGRHSKLSPTDKRSILTQITTGKAANAVQVTKHINTIISHPVFPQTVRNVPKQHSFKAVTKKKKLLLTAVHRKKRLAFALRHKEWTVEDWKRVIWSDGKQWVWKQTGDGLIEREGQGTVRLG